MRIIIQDNSEADWRDVISCIENVMANGRVSKNGKSFCYCTVFPKQKITVQVHLTKTGSDVFTVSDCKK